VDARRSNRQDGLRRLNRVRAQLIAGSRHIFLLMRRLRSPRALLISALLALMLCVSVGTFWSLYNWYRLQREPRSYPSRILASGEGWIITQSNGNKRVYQASIKSISIERAKLGAFAIGPLHVARLDKVIVDFYVEGLAAKTVYKPDTFGIDILENSLADIKKDRMFRSRKIKILVIKDISMNLWDGDTKVFSISSDQATIDRQTGDLLFVGHASLHAGSRGSVIAHRIRWVRKTSLFRITDPFILEKGSVRKEGRELETDYLLDKIDIKALASSR
jgi:hypothetical protein